MGTVIQVQKSGFCCMSQLCYFLKQLFLNTWNEVSCLPHDRDIEC
jgi:hypothetical protein